jgi:2-polyprenyl-3-methyl-5-hydroxy-6-metoxy-1,4-benzoquinol methylase
MDLSKRSPDKELLDEDGIPFSDIRLNMEELEKINTWLGGHAITITGMKALTKGRNKIHVCEIGCGGGDNLKAVARWCKKNKIDVQLTGIDVKDTCIEYAAINCKGLNIHLICSDYRTAVMPRQPDIIFSSLFCHHFSNADISHILQWKHQHAKIGYFVNDLHRNAIAYHSIKAITKIFSSSYLVQHDAPVSVTRGFSRTDWENIIRDADLPVPANLTWKWAFRWLISFKK